MSKILAFLKEYDFIWSIPMAFIGFVTYPIVGALIWGDGFGSYSPEFFHAGLYAGLIVILFNSFVQIGIFFNFPELYSYYLNEGFKELPTCTKIITFLTVYVFFFSSLVVIWKALV